VFTLLKVEVSLSGWLTAAVFGVLFTLLYTKVTECIEFRKAKNVMEKEFYYNLQHLFYKIWQRMNPDKCPRYTFYQIGSIALYNYYAPIIIRNKPEAAELIIRMYAIFEAAIEKDIFCGGEEIVDVVYQAQRICEIVGLNICNEEIFNMSNRDYGIP